MYKIRIHGRGGQGGKTAAKLIGLAAFFEGDYIQDFSVYGAERRGAPVTAFVRIDSKPILERGYIHDPDCIIVLDDSLLSMRELKIFDGLGRGGIILINTKKPKSKLKTPRGARIFTVNATQIALETIGRPIYNTAMLGALAKLTDVVDLAHVKKAIEKQIGKRRPHLVEKNIAAIQRCYDVVK